MAQSVLAKPLFEFEDTNFCSPQFYFDVKINTKEKETLYFCRFMLIRSSQYLKTLLCAGYKETEGNEIDLEYPKIAILSLLKYLNAFDNEEKKKSLVEVNNVMDLLEISHAINIQELSLRCTKFITDNIAEMNKIHGWTKIIAFYTDYIDAFSDTEQKQIHEYYKQNQAIYKQDPLLITLTYNQVFKAAGYYWPTSIELLNIWFQEKKNLSFVSVAIKDYLREVKNPSLTVLMDWAEKTNDTKMLKKVIDRFGQELKSNHSRFSFSHSLTI
jgi:hypothetical protein